MTNRELAALFGELADIMEIAGENHFKIRAYRNAAGAITNSRQNIIEIPPEKLREIAGIGKAISDKIGVANKTGTFPTLEKWRQSGYATLQPLLKIDDLTVRMLRGLMKDLGLTSMNDLRSSIADGRLSSYNKIDSKIMGKIIWMAKT